MRWSLALALTFGLGTIHGIARADTGACCFGPCDFPRVCEILTEEECSNEGGYYEGDGVACDDCPIFEDWPGPETCSVSPADAMNGVFLCPTVPNLIPASQILVGVRSLCGNPVQGASVTVLLTDDNPTCSGGGIQGTTNAQGEVVLTLSGSGCRSNQSLSALIKVNGMTIRSYSNAKSPDWDADGIVALGDLQQFAREFLEQTTDRCLDFDNNGSTGLSDLVLFGAAFMHANHCAP